MPVTTEQQIAEFQAVGEVIGGTAGAVIGALITDLREARAQLASAKIDLVREHHAFINMEQKATAAQAKLAEAEARIVELRNALIDLADDYPVCSVYGKELWTKARNAAFPKTNTAALAAVIAKEVAELEAKLAEAEKDAQRWKERAEFEYSKHMYPDNPGLAVGAIDAHMRAGWTWIGKQEAIDIAIAAQEKP